MHKLYILRVWSNIKFQYLLILKHLRIIAMNLSISHVNVFELSLLSEMDIWREIITVNHRFSQKNSLSFSGICTKSHTSTRFPENFRREYQYRIKSKIYGSKEKEVSKYDWDYLEEKEVGCREIYRFTVPHYNDYEIFIIIIIV